MTEEQTVDLAWTKLIESPSTVIVKIDEIGQIKDGSGCAGGVDGIVPPMPILVPARKESLFGTFHRQLRMSLKAVSDSPGPITRYRQTRFSSRRVRKRVIFKHGDCNVVQGNVAKRRRRYMQDIFTTLVDTQWRYALLIFALSFVLSWSAFAIIWWLISYTHGDLQYQRVASDSESAVKNETFIPCVTELYGYTSCFLFSIETQHTIGYGSRYITEECPEAIFIMCLQSITGVFIQAFMVGIVFAKLSRPKKRAQTLLFSRNAVICHRDGTPCLMFRVGDMRKSHIIEAHVRAQIIRKKTTKEGEVLPFYQQELAVGSDGGEDRLMFIWPTTIVHKIDRQSPLYALSAQDMLKERFEIVVMLEGVVESTGMTTQARSSYLPSEILWGHRFEHVVSFKKETGEYEVDYTTFNNTYEVDTPLCSARQLDEVRVELASPNGLERLCSAGLLPRVSSAASLEPASDVSLEETAAMVGKQKGARMRSFSIPNGVPIPMLSSATVFSPDTPGVTPSTTPGISPAVTPILPHSRHQHHHHHHHNSHRKLSTGTRRLSLRHDSMSIDSMC